MKQHRSKEGSLRSRTRIIAIYALSLIATCLVLILFWQGFHHKQRTENAQARGDHNLRHIYEPTIEVDGVSYRRRTGLTTILLMGIDKPSMASSAGSFRQGGQADFLFLLVIDSAGQTISQLQVDRDTMTPITVLNALGNRGRTRIAQLSLSHGFGDGKQQSCELTVEAASNLLFDIPIDFYIAMNMEGISVLNDLAGGVTVAIEDDFSSIDPAMRIGTRVKLVGNQAEIYVRSRMNIGIGTNEARMKRQNVYITQLLALLEEKQSKDSNFIGTVFDTLSPYLVTNISRGRLINEVWLARNYTRVAPIEPNGIHTIGSDGFMQFHVDEEELQRTVLALAYEERK